MASVQKVELDIQYSISGQGNAKVRVRSFLSFEPGEIGRAFRLRISLFGSDLGEQPKAVLQRSSPIYVFSFRVQTSLLGSAPSFRDENFDVVKATAISVEHDAERDVPLQVLDEDPGEDRTLVPGTPTWTPPIYAVTPHSDEIYAVSELLTSAPSNTVQLRYVPRIEQ